MKVDVNNNISVQYKLYSKETNVEWLNKAGFYPSDNKNWQYVFSDKLEGIRYKAKEDLPAKYKFNKPYSMSVYVDDSDGTRVGKAILTPVSIAADMTIAVASIAVIMTYLTVTGQKMCPGGC